MMHKVGISRQPDCSWAARAPSTRIGIGFPNARTVQTVGDIHADVGLLEVKICCTVQTVGDIHADVGLLEVKMCSRRQGGRRYLCEAEVVASAIRTTG